MVEKEPVTIVVSEKGWLRAMKIDFTAHHRLEAWSERCSARPAWKQVEG